MHTRCARLNHTLHKLERVEHPAEACLRIRNDRLQPIDGIVTLGVMQLIGSQ
jgi:hypothetical protein